VGFGDCELSPDRDKGKVTLTLLRGSDKPSVQLIRGESPAL
jgi:hypothetical protein